MESIYITNDGKEFQGKEEVDKIIHLFPKNIFITAAIEEKKFFEENRINSSEWRTFTMRIYQDGKTEIEETTQTILGIEESNL